jgi:hypothetical protein
MDVKGIVKEYLENNGFDGLCTEDCGCRNDDLMPCGEGFIQCVPGHLISAEDAKAQGFYVDDDCEFIIADSKPVAKNKALPEDV